MLVWQCPVLACRSLACGGSACGAPRAAPFVQAAARCCTAIRRGDGGHRLSTPIQMNPKTRSSNVAGRAPAVFLSCDRPKANGGPLPSSLTICHVSQGLGAGGAVGPRGLLAYRDSTKPPPHPPGLLGQPRAPGTIPLPPMAPRAVAGYDISSTRGYSASRCILRGMKGMCLLEVRSGSMGIGASSAAFTFLT